MLEFADFKKNAMQLSGKLMRYNAQYLGCMGFFSAMVPSTSSLEDSFTIGMVARSLSSEHDEKLLNFVKSSSRYARVSPKEFEAFKSKVLSGIYLIMWSHYNSTVSSYMNKSLIENLQIDLGVNSPQEMDIDLFNASLSALSQYCSYIYENRNVQDIYTDINRRLGTTIQADIADVINSRSIKVEPWYSGFSGVFCGLWMTNQS